MAANEGRQLPVGLLHDLVDSTSDFIAVVDGDGALVYLNPAARTLLELSADDEIEGRNVDSLLDAADAEALLHVAASGTRALARPKDGWVIAGGARRVPVSRILIPHRIDGSSFVSMIAWDISAQIAAEAELRHRADHDSLTDLYNRAALRTWIDDNGARQMVLALLDLDHFKHVNDTRGHAAGDEVLRNAAAALETTLGDRGRAARLGGDEFAFVLVDATVESSAQLVEQMLRALRAELTPHGVGISIGVADLDAPITLDEAMRRADHALYEHKRAGRAGVERRINRAGGLRPS